MEVTQQPVGDNGSPHSRIKKDHRQTLNRFTRHILGTEYIRSTARLHPKAKDAKRNYKQVFNLVERVHECETSFQNGTKERQDARPPKANLRGQDLEGEVFNGEESKSEETENGKKSGRKTKSQQLEPAHTFDVTLERDTFTEEKYLLFENYQRLVHHEPPSRISRSGFRNFLCSSPLIRTAITPTPDKQLGSYHQIYRLDDQLVALAVLDLLPNAVSAVYFIYHSSISAFAPGKLSALREIALTVESGRQWYMMGFYIEGCMKMRYKGQFGMQWLLDPEDYRWMGLDERVRTKLRSKKFVSLAGNELVDEGVENETTDSAKEDTSESLNDDLISSRRPLTEINMPGILTLDQLTADVLDNIKLQIGDVEAVTSDLISWESSKADNPGSIKCVIADLVAAVGVETAAEMVIYFE